jgi:hypothetical protein
MKRPAVTGTSSPALLALLLGSLAGCGGAAAPWASCPELELDLRVAVAPTAAGLLQPVAVTLDLFRRQGLEVEFAPTVPSADFVTTTRSNVETPLFDGHWRRLVLECKPVRPGELALPAFVAKQRGGELAASTPATTIVVASALGATTAATAADLPALAAQALDPVGEPFPTPSRLGYWLAGGLVAALLLAGGVRWWRRQGLRRRQQAAAVAVPPHVVALRALQRLRGQSRTTRAEIETFYVEVSQVLRVYLEQRFGLRAPERTTEEFLREIESGDGLVRERRAELERFLHHCDLVKFAAHEPVEADHLATFAVAEAFVEATRADRAATTPATEPPAAAAPRAEATA